MLASVAVVVATLFGSPATALAEPIFGGFGGSKSATLEMKVQCCHASGICSLASPKPLPGGDDVWLVRLCCWARAFEKVAFACADASG